MATKREKRTLGADDASRVKGETQDASARRPRLIPGLRNRLLALTDEAKIPAKARIAYLASLTGCAPQTVRRWLRSQGPGLPDLDSAVRLCIRFDIDANWL